MTCLLCGSPKIIFYLEKDGYKYWRCRECNFIFLEKFPDQVADIYQKGYFNSDSLVAEGGYVNYENDKKVLSRFLNDHIDQIKKFFPAKNPTLLDIGTSTGYFLSLAEKKGILAEGLEISYEMATLGQSYGRKIYLGQSGKLSGEFLQSKSGYYDIITLWDCIEHLCDIKKSFEEINQLLKPQGLILINTVDSGSLWARFFGKNWHSYVPPEHVIFFDQKNIAAFLDKNGYKTIKIKTVYKKFTWQYCFNMIYRWRRKKFFYLITRFLANHPRLGHLPIKLPVGDNMIILAIKK